MKQVLVALDQLANTFFGGWADETLSSRAWRTAEKGKILAIVARMMIDALFFWDKTSALGHCHGAYVSELERRNLPPSMRT